MINRDNLTRENYDKYREQERPVRTKWWWIKMTVLFLILCWGVYEWVNPRYKTYVRTYDRWEEKKKDTIAVRILDKYFRQDSLYLCEGVEKSVYRISEEKILIATVDTVIITDEYKFSKPVRFSYGGRPSYKGKGRYGSRRGRGRGRRR